MTKTQFIDALAVHLGITKAEANRVAYGYAAVVTQALKDGADVVLPDLAKASTKAKPATPAMEKRNPFSGHMVMVAAKPASKKVALRAVAALKKALV
jgi:nucleoid DNA-binding protein